MAEAPKRSKKKSKFNILKLFKRKSKKKDEENRRATQPPRVENQQQREDYRHSSPPTDFAVSGYYSEIPEKHFDRTLFDIKDNQYDTYLEPQGADEQARYPRASGSDGYISPIGRNPSEHEISGVFALDSARKAENARISGILKQQEVTDKTLYINYDEPPEIPERIFLASPSKEEQPPELPQKLPIFVDAAVGDSLPINLYENKEFDLQKNGKEKGEVVGSQNDSNIADGQTMKDSVCKSSDYEEVAEPKTDKPDNPVSTSETQQNNYNKPDNPVSTSETQQNNYNKPDNPVTTSETQQNNYNKPDIPVTVSETQQNDNKPDSAVKILNGVSKTTNLLCFQKISSETTDETLTNYLEVIANKSGYPVEISNIVHGNEGTVVVQFTDDIDGFKLSEEMKKRPLHNTVLRTCEITASNAVVISSEHNMPADDTIRNHFENDFGHVIALADMEFGVKVITFQDCSVAKRICCKSSHTVTGSVLTVSLLYECAFGKIWDTKLHKLNCLPSDIQIKETEPLLEAFIRSNEKLVRLLNDKLREDFAKISVDREFVITCTLHKSDNNFHNIARNWEGRVVKKWKKCLDDLTIKEELDIPGDILEKVLRHKQTIEADYKDEILMVLNEKRNMTSLNIVGLKQSVQKVVLDLKTYIVNNREIIVFVSLHVSSYHIGLLEADGVISVVKAVENVEIETKSSEGQVVIKGGQPNIDSAEKHIRNAISGFHSWTLNSYSNDHITILQNRSVSNAVKLNLKTKGVTTEFEFKDGRLTVHTNSVGSLKLVETVISENIVQHVLPLEDQSLTVIFLSEWEDFVNEIKVKYFGTVIIRPDDSGNIVITSVKNKLHDVLIRTQDIIARLKTQKVAENKAIYEQLESAKDNNTYQTLDTRVSICAEGAASNTEKNAFVTAKRKIKVIIEEMPLTKKKVDVMSCVAPLDLDFSYGQLLRSILKDGGKMVEEDCKNKYPNGIELGQIAEVKAGNLPCSQLYIGYLPQYRRNHEIAEKALTNFVFGCLNMSSKHGHSTIAFPSLGTGNGGYPHSVVAKLMYDAVKDFDKQTKSSTLHKIFFVILPSNKESLQAFRCEEKGQK